jgi:hypothetical protein
LIHDDQDPVGPQGGRFTPVQIETPEAVLQVAQDSSPGWTIGIRVWLVVIGENPSNPVFIDWYVEGQGNLLSDSWAAPSGIEPLHLEDGFQEFLAGSLGSGLAAALGGEEPVVFLMLQGLVEAEESRRL